MHLEASRVSLSGSLLSFRSQYLSPNAEVASAASPNSQPAPGPETASHLVVEIGFQGYLTFFYMGAGDLNSSRHTYLASILSTELSPSSSV